MLSTPSLHDALPIFDSIRVTGTTFPIYNNTSAGKAPKVTHLTNTGVMNVAANATIAGGLSIQGPLNLNRSEEHTSELQSLTNLVCRLLLEKKKTHNNFVQIGAEIGVGGLLVFLAMLYRAGRTLWRIGQLGRRELGLRQEQALPQVVPRRIL